MANYSATLESGLSGVIGTASSILTECNNIRSGIHPILSIGLHWRDYSNDLYKLFDLINSIERSTLAFMDATDNIRKENDRHLATNTTPNAGN